MKSIILIQINYTQDHSEKILPMGILSVGSALKKAGEKVELININDKEISKTVWSIRGYFKFLNWKPGPLVKWFEWRIKNRFFSFPIDIYLAEYLADLAIEQKRFLVKV
jgi:hypothetical protein